ncbi:micrococcal nuclease [Persephonella hydrogeniphila]|uniref:Micrococcal nuclease n=1 Tax=Persephonella hydrogeniphila TaxID=198703 RepID=A0A285MYK8_9AQUI|nr:thermonuclease family protein [Persephonella hydrogeniphila]SNZ02289.1 micrococcal nuclease [Persephonella hydrogeniphila]
MKRLKSTAMRVKIFFLFLFAFFSLSYASEKWKPPRDFVKAKVLRVVDGDTIVISIKKTTFNNRKTLKNLKFTVRLIGIDTPESKPNRRAKLQSRETDKDVKTIVRLGKRAKLFTESLLSKGKRKYSYVFLEFDIQPQDRYGRLLAYVWLPDGRMLNKEIICGGYAYPLTIPPNVKYEKEFLRCFRYARENKLGLWR